MLQLADPFPPIVHLLHTILGAVGGVLALVAIAVRAPVVRYPR